WCGHVPSTLHAAVQFTCASACSNQYVIPISRYIVVAMVRCSCACSGAAGAIPGKPMGFKRIAGGRIARAGRPQHGFGAGADRARAARGARVWRLGDDPDAPWVLSTVPRHGRLAGFDLHANVGLPAADRGRLEQLCRYLLRPAVAQDRLRLLADGRVVLTLKSAWTDGTRHTASGEVTVRA